MKDRVRDAVIQSFKAILDNDGSLFDCQLEVHADYDPRKLHEVCINHKLACYLENQLEPLLVDYGKMFVDIEFNREGIDFKNLQIGEKEELVRPDIIVHNRKSNSHKINFLVVECKKKGATSSEIEEDIDKLKAFLEDVRYRYKFGLQVLYDKNRVSGELLFMENGAIVTESVEYLNGDR